MSPLVSGSAPPSCTAALMAPAPEGRALASAYQILAQHSKSFALAARALPPEHRAEAAVVYSWCRRVDDAVDLAATPPEALQALAQERQIVDDLYRGTRMNEPLLAAFQTVIRRRQLPEQILVEMLEGMQMDVDGHRYWTMDALGRYCFRVAGTVGVMMSHVLGLRQPDALKQAAHLGMAMQLTNICRDVLEDWGRGRLYLPESILAEEGLADLHAELGRPLRREHGPRLARVVQRLLAQAEAYYRSGDAGLSALSWRSAWAVRAAREVYAEIGAVLAARGHDVFAGRAIVPFRRKLVLLARALAKTLGELPKRLSQPFRPCSLPNEVVIDELIRL